MTSSMTAEGTNRWMCHGIWVGSNNQCPCCGMWGPMVRETIPADSAGYISNVIVLPSSPIVEVACSFFNVSKESLLDHKLRYPLLQSARQAVAMVARFNANMTLGEVASLLNMKGPSSAVATLKGADGRYGTNFGFRKDVHQLLRLIQELPNATDGAKA